MRVCRILVLLCLACACVDLTRPVQLTDDGGIGLVPDTRPDRPGASEVGDAPAQTDTDPDVVDVDGGPSDLVDVGGDGAPDGPPPPAPLDLGRPCDEGGQCGSGFCAQGVCCQSACLDVCMACNQGPAAGMCTPVPAGEDPEENCVPEAPASCGLDGTCNGQGACRRYPAGAECMAGKCTAATEYAASTCDGNGTCLPGLMRACASGMCMGGTCASPCTKSTDCQSGFFCAAGKCALKQANASACASADQCGTGFCVDGVCCASLCKESCFSCNVAGSPGTCKPVPSGQDPRSQCPAEAAATCGRAGGCNGAGACRLYPANTVCGGSSCAGSTETPAPRCDGIGVCRPAAARDCNPYLCGANACLASCTDSAACGPGFSCQANVCARIPGLALFWRFEEASGTMAVDASGNGHHGIYIGDIGIPTPAVDLPTLMYANTRSRAFLKANRHAVQLQTPAAVLQAANDFTFAAWYRATRIDTGGSEVMSGWNGYVLRLRPTGVELSKRNADPAYLQCLGNTPGFLDGRWHHVAGVISRTTGMKLYFDGTEVCSMNDRVDITYPPEAVSFFVGRHGAGQDQWDFDGNVDEVRFYSRPLLPAEITALAQGRN